MLCCTYFTEKVLKPVLFIFTSTTFRVIRVTVLISCAVLVSTENSSADHDPYCGISHHTIDSPIGAFPLSLNYWNCNPPSTLFTVLIENLICQVPSAMNTSTHSAGGGIGGLSGALTGSSKTLPATLNAKEFKQKQIEIKERRREGGVTSGPQSHVLEGVTYEELARQKVGSFTPHLMVVISKGNWLEADELLFKVRSNFENYYLRASWPKNTETSEKVTFLYYLHHQRYSDIVFCVRTASCLVFTTTLVR